MFDILRDAPRERQAAPAQTKAKKASKSQYEVGHGARGTQRHSRAGLTDKDETPEEYQKDVPAVGQDDVRKGGAGGRNRTHDRLITNQLLYRLSYASTKLRWYSSLQRLAIRGAPRVIRV